MPETIRQRFIWTRFRAAVLTVGCLTVLVPASAGANNRAESLTRDSSRTSVLAPDEVHSYEAELRQGDYLHVLVEQQDIDLVVAVGDPTGHAVTEVDTPYGRTVPESVALIAEKGGTYRLTIRPFRSVVKAGSYRLIVEAWRLATPADRQRVAAEKATNTAHRRAAKRTADDLRAAIDHYLAARELWRRLDEPIHEARLVHRIGQLQRRLGDTTAALTTQGDALTVARDAGDQATIATILNELGTVHRRRGENRQALQSYRESLDIWQALANVVQEAKVRNNLGHTLQGMGELTLAQEHYERALQTFQQLGERLNEARVLTSLGPLHTRLGRIDRAAAVYEEALTLAQAVGRRGLEADVLNNIGLTLRRLGELHAAIDSFDAALAIYRELGDGRRQAATLNSQGDLLLALGLPEEAQYLLQTATELLQEHGDPYVESRVFLGLGVAARDVGDFTGALALFERAIELQRRTEDRHGEASSLYHQAVVHYRDGRESQARELARQTLTIVRELSHVEDEDRALRILGQSAAALGEIETAQRAFADAAALAESTGDITEHATCLRELARLEYEAGRLPVALEHLENAISQLEGLRAKISGQHLRASHFATTREVYETTIDVLMRLHRQKPAAGFDRRALAISERARARGLFDVLSRARVDFSRDPGILTRERELRRELAALALQRRRTTAPDATLQARITALTTEYRLLEGRLEPSAESTMGGSDTSPHFLNEVATWLDGDTALLEITLGEPRSYLWVVTPDTLESFELPGRTAIEKVAERLHRHLGQPAADRTERRAALEELSRLLVEPAFGELSRQRWVIVPDGALHYVPFAALPVPRRAGATDGSEAVPLMVEHEVIHLPSVAVLGELRRAVRRPVAGRLAVLADPVFRGDDPRHQQGPKQDDDQITLSRLRKSAGDELARLPWSGEEARAIVAEVGTDGVLTALGFDASRELVTSPDLGLYRVVHLATHGVLDTRHPELSGLAFSGFDAAGRRQPSFLHLQDIYPLRWQTELVVLSGCRTALGRTMQGEGLIGLARGFLHAGAAQVVASLWSVRDRATAELMRRFYAALFRDGQSPAAALRAAQLSMWQERRWRDPYFWAPFILIGDWQTAETTP